MRHGDSQPVHRCLSRPSFLADTGMEFTGLALGALLFEKGVAHARGSGAVSPWRPPDMQVDLRKVEESKRQMRRRLAALPFGEKLRILDKLRERSLSLRAKPAPAANHFFAVPQDGEPLRIHSYER